MIKTSCVVAMSAWLIVLGLTSVSAQQEPLRVAATVSELGSLAREMGGEHVTVVVFAKGTEDAHFVEAKPSFIKELSQADVYIQAGMDLEAGWAPVLLQNARNSKILPGAPGYIDASTVITPLDVPTGPIDRSMGDVHPAGNPHYLTDPLNGLRGGGTPAGQIQRFTPGTTGLLCGALHGFSPARRGRAGRRNAGPEVRRRQARAALRTRPAGSVPPEPA